MGFSVTAATAILFAAAFISLATLLGGYSVLQTNQSEAERYMRQHFLDAGQESIEIMQINQTRGTITVANQGSSELATDDIDVVINGTLRTDNISDAVIIDTGHTAVWFPGELLLISMDCSLAGATVLVYAGTSARAFAG